MQYCSLQHRTLLPSPCTSITGCCFCFDSIFIISGFISPLISSSILGNYRPGEFIFQCPIFLHFYTVYGKNTEVVCRSLFQWTTFCQNSPPWPICLGLSFTAWLIASLSYMRLWSMWSFWLAFYDSGLWRTHKFTFLLQGELQQLQLHCPPSEIKLEVCISTKPGSQRFLPSESASLDPQW